MGIIQLKKTYIGALTVHGIIALRETEQHKRSLLKFQWLRTTLQYLQPENVKTPSFFDLTLPHHRKA